MWPGTLTWVFACIAVLMLQPAGTEDVPLTLAVFISAINTTGSITGSSDVGRPFVEAVNLAVELVNNNTDLIPGYSLEYELADSQV